VRLVLKEAHEELSVVSKKPAEALNLEPADVEQDEDAKMIEISEDETEIRYVSSDDDMEQS
jgi:hypothetical protein